jgi:cell division protein ZapA
MEKMTSTVRVNIYGDEYPIKGAADPEHIQKIAAFVNERMKAVSEKAPPRDKLRIAVLAAINIASELFEVKGERGSDVRKKLSEFEIKTEELSKKIAEII